MTSDNDIENLINKNIMDNYDLLSEKGIIEYIEVLNHEIVNKNEIIDEAIEIFNKKDLQDLVEYINKKFLDKFIPETLTIVLQNDANNNKADIISFKNLKQTNYDLNIENFSVYKEFFALSPVSINFDAFVVMIDDKKLTDPFLKLNPELLVPMIGLDGIYGFIIFGRKMISDKYEKKEIEFIDGIMKFVSISLQNIIHYKLAIMDLKTRLYNHDFFIRRLTQEISRVKRYGSEFAVLMFDIDHFKHINDTYGHVAGDKIIKVIAKTIQALIRSEDVAARFGGEEFVVMLVECKREFAFAVAERIRKKIEGYIINFENKVIRMTISIGGEHVTAQNADSPQDIINRADKALYYSKENGRNRSTIANSEE